MSNNVSMKNNKNNNNGNNVNIRLRRQENECSINQASKTTPVTIDAPSYDLVKRLIGQLQS